MKNYFGYYEKVGAHHILADMTIPIPNKDSMACLQTSKTKFMITDILSSSEKDNNNQNVNNTNNSGSEIHNNNNNNNNSSHHQHQTHPHLPPHHLMVGRDSFSHHHHHLASLQNARMSSPEYDDLQDGASDCDSDEMGDDNSVSSNGKLQVTCNNVARGTHYLCSS